MTSEMSHPVTVPGTEWRRAADLAVGTRIYGGEVDGIEWWAAVSSVEVKPKTIWLRLAIQQRGYCVAIQHQRPRHDDRYMVATDPPA